MNRPDIVLVPSRDEARAQPSPVPAAPLAPEWRRHWPLVLTAVMGFSFYSFMPYSFGLFMEPLGRDFGWSRTQVSLGMIIPSICLVLLSPVVGGIIDRWGSRCVALPGLVLCAIAITALGHASGSVTQWLLLWLFFGMVHIAISTTVWTTPISAAFAGGRGLALGLTLCGMAVAQIVGPPLTRWLIDTVGWRAAFQFLGLGWGAPCLLFALFFLHDRRTSQDATQALSAGTEGVPGLSIREAFRSVALIKLGLATLITMSVGVAMLAHQVPILTSAGATRESAAWLASLAGLTGIAGKLITGWMTDRWNPLIVGGLSISAPAIGYVIQMTPGASLQAMVISMMIIGYATGTKMQICAFLTARYAGMRNYGKIFGLMTSIIGIAGSLGTIGAGAIYDHYGSYRALLACGVAGSVISAMLLFWLGPAPRFASPAVRQPGVSDD